VAIAFDGPNKRINLTSTTTLSVKELWSRWVDWWLTDDNSKYGIWMLQVGGDDIDEDAGTAIPIYIFLATDIKIKPQEANHTLKVVDGILLVSGGGDPFVNTIGSYVVRINYQQPVQAIGFDSGGGGGLTTEEHDQLMNVPLETLTTEEHDKLMDISPSGLTTEEHNQLMEVLTLTEFIGLQE